MRILFSILLAGFLFFAANSSSYALSPMMGENSGTYCERCKNSGANCACSIGIPKESWDCKCGPITHKPEKSEAETASLSKEPTVQKKERPTTFMDALQKTVNMPRTTSMGMEVEGAEAAPPQ